MKRRHTARAIPAIAALTLAACGGPPASQPTTGRVDLRINGVRAMTAVTVVTVSVAPSGTSVDIVPDRATDSFTGTLSLPVGAQVITAKAYAGATLVGQGSASVTVAGGQTLSVTIIVLDVTGPEPAPDHAPLLTSLTVSAAVLDVGQTLTLGAAAVDVDGDPITFTWSATPAGCVTFAPATATRSGAVSTTASTAIAGPCAISVEAAARGLSDSLTTSVDIRLPVTVGGIFVPQPVIGSVEFLSQDSATVLRSATDATVHHVWTAGVPVSVRFSWDATPWLDRSTATLSDSCGGAIGSTGTTDASETFDWTPTGGPVCVLTARVDRKGLVDSFPVAVAVEPTPCVWTEVAFHDLTSAPPGAIVRNGVLDGQGPASVAGRQAWLQASDWNVLLIPNMLASGDDAFAVEVDAYVPPASGFELASLVPFTTSDTAPGPQGTCQFLGGVWGALRASGTTAAAAEWWSAACPNTLLASSPAPDPTGAWHRLRIDGLRSTCRYHLRLDGFLLSTWTGTCDSSGSYLNLFGSASGVAGIAWSNISIQRGSSSVCVP